MAVKKNIVTEGGNSVFFPTVVVVDSHGKPLSVTDDGELWVTETERERNVEVLLSATITANATAYHGVIDLSDTTNWKHTETGALHVSNIIFNIDKALAARGAINLGVITRIDGTSADISYVGGYSFEENDTASQFIVINLAPTQRKLNVVGGVLANVKTDNLATGVTAINTGMTLSHGANSFTPAVGDVLLRTVKSAGGNYRFGLALYYHAHP